MESVADELRREQRAKEAALSAAQRFALCLRLGREALARLSTARDLSESEAREVLRRNRQAGRRSCSFLDGPKR